MINSKPKIINMSLRLNEKLKAGIERKANDLGISANAAISLAVDEYIKSQQLFQAKD
ncbi:hypothetical protein Ga0466249_002205 [Sporomusaceae bacterium BoRhaA]|uniref:hypothetical protein n=1 Tax=Pelorhabdus rhamnosifermentans TaxID=2772457 RepID=UPI001C064312|nr:hypothetical protein [Pelorhabdus rhamnosifermentans]MBU2701094.1 hypothetical protein [Pelorhabdus rhamnosifermentans]